MLKVSNETRKILGSELIDRINHLDRHAIGNKVRRVLQAFKYGILTVGEMRAGLDKLRVRGAMDDKGKFTGYDYGNQCWIELLIK